MSTVVKSYEIHISSSQRSSGDSDYFSINFRKPFHLTDEKNTFRLRVVSAEIPYSFTQISNNIITGYYIVSDISYNFSFTITAGNYNVIDLLNHIKVRFNLINFPHKINSFNFIYDAISGKVSLGLTSSQPYTFHFNSANDIFTSLGFNSSTNLEFSTSTILTSDKHVILNPINTLFIRSDNLIQLATEFILEKDVICDIISKIHIDTAPNTWIMYENQSAIPIYINNRIIDKIQLYLSSNKSYNLT